MHKQSPSDDNESAANGIVEGVNPDSSQDLPACTDAPVCDDNDNVTDIPVNGLVGRLSDLMSDAERMQVDKSAHSQPVDSEPSNNTSLETVIGNHLSNPVAFAAACYNNETVENVTENQDENETSQLLFACTVMAESCEFDSIQPPVSTVSTNMPPADNLRLLTDGVMQESTDSHMQQSAPDTIVVEQLQSETNVAENTDANHTCHILVDSTVMAENCEFDAIPPPVSTISANLPPADNLYSLTFSSMQELTDSCMPESAPDTNAVEQLNGETGAAENQITNHTCLVLVDSTVMAENCEFDVVPPPVSTISANLPLADSCMLEPPPDTNAVEQIHCETDASECIDRQPNVELTSAESSPHSVEMLPDFCDTCDNDMEPLVTAHSVSSDVLSHAIDSGAAVTDTGTSKGNYPLDSSQITRSLDPQFLSIMSNVEKFLLDQRESGFSDEVAGSRQNVSEYSPSTRQLSSSDQMSAPPVSSGSWTAQHSDGFRSDVTCTTHTRLDNSAVGCRASNTAAENAVDICPSVVRNDEANRKAQSIGRLPVTTGKSSTAVPTSIELQRKIIRQMEVCVQFAFLLVVF